jgi:CelD/BcsL family acetyltransferase involved in cellulose biosynthesis
MSSSPGTARSIAETQLLTSAAALEQVRPEWQRLWSEDPAATPFHAPQWLLPWWRHLGQGELLSLALRDDQGSLAGFAPLYIYTDRASGKRHLFPVGIGTSDYLGLLARDGWADAVAAKVLSQVLALQDAWDVFECPQLRGQDALLRAPVACRREVSEGEPNPVLALDTTHPPLPKAILANLRTCRNRAARTGELLYQAATAADIPEFLAALTRLHASRWQQRGLPGVLADDAVRAAHAEAAPLLHAAGLLRMHALRLEGEIVAVLYALLHARRCYYYIGGFDPRHAAFSPGALLLAHAIGQAMAEGATDFDFLRGAEPYKYRWGALDQPMFALRLFSEAASRPA